MSDQPDSEQDATGEDGIAQCPFCKEEIKTDAILCKHCGSHLQLKRPSHGGTCPFCKEEIKADAVVCKHCRSQLGPSEAGGRGCGGCRLFGSTTFRSLCTGCALNGRTPVGI